MLRKVPTGRNSLRDEIPYGTKFPTGRNSLRDEIPYGTKFHQATKSRRKKRQRAGGRSDKEQEEEATDEVNTDIHLLPQIPSIDGGGIKEVEYK